MSWFTLAILSACFLGLYDLVKKAALRDNAVAAVLFVSVLSAAAVWAPLIAVSSARPDWLPWSGLQVDPLTLTEHGLIFVKSLLVGGSWACAYAAIKHLPISIAAPIRATSPLWTILLATTLMGERPNGWQWLGIIVILISFYTFSFVGRWEGIHFRRDPWVGLMFVATLLAALSALYDKYLLQTCRIPVATVQAWFSVDLVAVTCPFFLHWLLTKRASSPFHWRWSVPLIGIVLLVTDFVYFSAIQQPGAMISLISPLRRTSVLITLLAGIHIYREQNFYPKAACVGALIVGALLLGIR